MTGAAALLLLPVVLDVFFARAGFLGARIEHAAVQAVLGTAVRLERMRLLEHEPRRVQLQAAGIAVVVVLLLDRLERSEARPRRAAAALLGAAVGLPLLAAQAASAGVASALAPSMFLVLLAATAAGLAVGRGRAPVPLGPSGLPRPQGRRRTLLLRLLVVAAGVAMVVNGATLLASGPGDDPVPLAVALLVERSGLPPAVLTAAPAALCLGLAGGIARRARPRARLEVLAAVAAGGFGAVVVGGWGPYAGPQAPLAAGPAGAAAAACGFALGSWGLRPAFLLHPHPLRSAGRLLVLLPATVFGLLWVAAAGFLGCEEVLERPEVTRIHPSTGSFALQAVPRGGGAVVVALRDRGVLLHLALDGSTRRVIEVRDLPLSAWDAQPEHENRKVAYPEELGLDGEGRVHAWVEVPGPESAMARVLLDEDGEVLGVEELPDACYVSSFLWDPGRAQAVAGCEWRGEWMRSRPGQAPAREVVEGAGELEELVLASDGSYLATSLWTDPWLMRIDPDRREVVQRRWIGAFNWGLGLDPAAKRVWVARFHARQLLVLDEASLEPVGLRRVGYGVRALEVAEERGRVYAASTYDGLLRSVPLGEGEARSLRLGGWVRDLARAPDGSLLAGGLCGVLRVDLDAWESGAAAYSSSSSTGLTTRPSRRTAPGGSSQ